MGSGEVKDNLAQLRRKAELLREELAYHEHRYHVLEYPIVSRARYFEMRGELAELERRIGEIPFDSPSLRRPAEARPAFERSEHHPKWRAGPVIASQADLRAHYQALEAREGRPPVLIGSARVIGAELALTYVDGVLDRATLRGDGEEGEDVTDNVRCLGSVPLKLRPPGSITESRVTRASRQAIGPSTTTPVPPFPDELTVRGVLTLRNLDIQGLDRQRIDAGEPPYVGPAAAIEASVRRLDPAITAERKLRLFAYELGTIPPGIDSQWQLLGALKSWGFAVTSLAWRCVGYEEILDFIHALQEEQPGFEHPLEGGVLYSNDLADYEDPDRPGPVVLRFTSVARKAKADMVFRAVGRAGTIIPVARLGRAEGDDGPIPSGAPVPAISGSAVLRVEPGSTVRVIPGPVAPLLMAATEQPPAGEPFSTCPACGAFLKRPADEPFARCENTNCRGRSRARILHLIGPRGLRLKSLSARNVDGLLGLSVQSLADLLELDPKAVDGIAPGFGGLFAAEVENFRRLALWRVLFLSSIPYVGERAARIAAAELRTVDALLRLTPASVGRALGGLGSDVRRGVATWLGAGGLDTIRRLLQRGVDVLGDEVVFSAPFLGKHVVLGGAFSIMPLERTLEEVERRGARIEPRVSRRTDLVVLGKDADELAEQARVHGVVTVDEPTLVGLLQMELG